MRSLEEALKVQQEWTGGGRLRADVARAISELVGIDRLKGLTTRDIETIYDMARNAAKHYYNDRENRPGR